MSIYILPQLLCHEYIRETVHLRRQQKLRNPNYEIEANRYKWEN